MGDDETSSPSGDKRRNKLGYQRTTVACSHCRRRKIRCLLPTPEDPQGRCINCIRLKKDCNFHPVDHAPDLRPGRKDSTSGQSPTSTSSPRTPAGPASHLLLESQVTSPFDQHHVGVGHGSSSTSLPTGVVGSLEDFNTNNNAPAYMNGTNRSLSMPYDSSGTHHLLQPSFTLSSTEEASEWSHHSPSFPHPSSTGSAYWASGENTPNSSTFPRPHILQPTSAYGSPSLPYGALAGHHGGSHSWAPSRSQSFSNFESLQQQQQAYNTYPATDQHQHQHLPPHTPDLTSGHSGTGTPLGYADMYNSSAPGSSITTPSALGGHHSPESSTLEQAAMGHFGGHHQQPWMSPDSIAHSDAGSPWYDGVGGRDGYRGMDSPVYPSRTGTG